MSYRFTSSTHRQSSVAAARRSSCTSEETQQVVLRWEEFKQLVYRHRLRSERSGRPFYLTFYQLHEDALPAPLDDALQLLQQRAALVAGPVDAVSIIEESATPVGVASLALHADLAEVQRRADAVVASHAQTLSEKPCAPARVQAVSYHIEAYPPSVQSATEADANVRLRISPLLPFGAGRALPGWKRLLDLAGAGMALLLLAPLLMLTAVYIKLVSPGPVFFGQRRIGYLGREFTCWKFRSMHTAADTRMHQQYLESLIRETDDADTDEGRAMVKLKQDPRVIRGGRFLRASSIDELPQLFNVLRGEMSLVGPRPPIPYEVVAYQAWNVGRFESVPGLTGLWQVEGKNRLTFKEMVRLDIRYARQRSLGLDLYIILKTPWVILQQVYEDRYGEKE